MFYSIYKFLLTPFLFNFYYLNTYFIFILIFKRKMMCGINLLYKMKKIFIFLYCSFSIDFSCKVLLLIVDTFHVENAVVHEAIRRETFSWRTRSNSYG